MKELLKPKTIAVIGASNHKSKVGYSLMENLRKFQGVVIPVNNHGKKIMGKKCYRSILHIEKEIDLAIIAIPSPFVKIAVREARQKGVKTIIIISAGFSETGKKNLEDEIMRQKGDVRILGPNCISGSTRLLISNSNHLKDLEIGGFIDSLLQKNKECAINISGTQILDLSNIHPKYQIASYDGKKFVKKRILKLMKRSNVTSAIKIRLEGGNEITCSEDHPLLVSINGKIFRKDAKSANMGDKLLVVHNLALKNQPTKTINVVEEIKNKVPREIQEKIQIIYKNKRYPFLDFVKNNIKDLKDIRITTKNKQITIPGLLPITNELCVLLGYFIADGNYKKDCLRIGYTKCDYAEKKLREAIDIVFSSSMNNTKRCTKDFKFGREIGVILFKYIFEIGTNSKIKSLPNFLYNAEPDKIISFLSGLYSGDGGIYHYKNKNKSILFFHTISKHLLDQVRFLFNILGVGPFYIKTYNRTNANIKGKPCKAQNLFMLRSDSKHVITKLYKLGFDFIVKTKKDKLQGVLQSKYPPFDRLKESPLYACRIKSVKKISGPMDLYDFEVEDTHNFVADQILTSNCFGVVNPYNGLDTTFARTTPRKGDIAFISQSGAIWSGVAELSKKEDFGFSGFVSLGNMMDIGFEDTIQYFDNDENTRIIVLYLETLKDGRKIMQIAKKCKKKIIAVKAGMSEAGIKATLSHTGSMAGSYEIYRAAFKQSGIVMAESLTEAFDKAKYGLIEERKTVVITNAGGPGALMADCCEKNGLELVKIPNIKFDLPEAWSKNNPMDLVGDAKSDRFKEVFSKIQKEKFYDLAVIVVTPQKMTDLKNIAHEIVRFKKESKKKVVVCWMTDEGREIFENAKIPYFFEPKRLAEYLRL